MPEVNSLPWVRLSFKGSLWRDDKGFEVDHVMVRCSKILNEYVDDPAMNVEKSQIGN